MHGSEMFSCILLGVNGISLSHCEDLAGPPILVWTNHPSLLMDYGHLV